LTLNHSSEGSFTFDSSSLFGVLILKVLLPFLSSFQITEGYKLRNCWNAYSFPTEMTFQNPYNQLLLHPYLTDWCSFY